jgi:hypothetical protein
MKGASNCLRTAGDFCPAVEQYLGAPSDAAFTHPVCPHFTDTHRDVFLISTR